MNHKNKHLEILLNDIWSLSAFFVLAWFVPNQTSRQLLKGSSELNSAVEFLRAKIHIYTLYTHKNNNNNNNIITIRQKNRYKYS